LIGNVDMRSTGEAIAGSLETAFGTAISAQPIGSSVATKWASSFASSQPLFVAIGTSAGEQVGDATVKAILNKIGGVVKKLAEVIAPEVALLLPPPKASSSLP
jgi:hypothetical protein